MGPQAEVQLLKIVGAGGTAISTMPRLRWVYLSERTASVAAAWRSDASREPSCPTKVTPMSMAVCGNNPSSKAGEYFEAAGLQWLPLVEERPRGSWRDSLTEFKPWTRTVQETFPR